MSEEMSTARQKVDLSIFSDTELDELLHAIHKETERRKERKKREALERMRKIAEEVGMTPEELLGIGGKGRRKEGRRGGIAWQHPHDPTKIYRGGAKPPWMKELAEQGRKPVKVG